MIKKLKLTVASIAMTFLFACPQLLHAMDIENEAGKPVVQKTQAMTITEKNAYKMWLFDEAQVQAKTNNTFLPLSKDVQKVIGNILHELTENPVLRGMLIFKSPSDKQQFSFRIKDLVKEGTLDFTNPIFKGMPLCFVMTLDPTRFFQKGKENANKVIILIAPRSLIEEKIESTTAPFSTIMPQWDENVAPIGFFWRYGNWDDSQSYEHLTNKKIDEINSENLYHLLLSSTTHHSTIHHNYNKGHYLDMHYRLIFCTNIYVK